MAFWEGQYQAMDPLTLSTIIQLQLEDSQEFVSNAKGKQREGTVSDAEFAFRMYTEDLISTSATLSDRKMAQSMAIAIIKDGQFIQRAYQQEDQIARDHEMATNLEADAPAPVNVDLTSKTQAPQEHDPWTDTELLEKAAAIYMYEPCTAGHSPPELVIDSDSNNGTVAESSAWAASRRTNDKPRLGHCVACGEDKDFLDVARIPCKDKHEYCRECLAQLFELSLTDESLFPPRCDNEPIPLALVRIFLPAELAKRFETMYTELSTKNRVYCHDPKCSAFIPTRAIGEETDIGTCPRCDKTTCAICKAPSHTGDCPEDTELQQLVSTANTEQWQRCLDCKRFVQLETGCNHIT
ncbi:hypothetical protein LTR08_002520 [Meristemomyces frigidus]|nr:hypothetical protein LTR08_002520 [Meristemomyces frigidus]